MQKQGIYILRCVNFRYYVGSTNDLDRRLFEHQNGLVKATRNVLPVKLVFFEDYQNIIQARQIEYKLKKLKSRKIIEKIINNRRITIN